MSNWPASKARRVRAAIGWRVKRVRGSHELLSKPGWPDYEFAFHDADEIGPKMLAKVAKHTGLGPEDSLGRSPITRFHDPNSPGYTSERKRQRKRDAVRIHGILVYEFAAKKLFYSAPRRRSHQLGRNEAPLITLR